MKALITGVAGYVGSNLKNCLQNDGWDVYGIDKKGINCDLSQSKFLGYDGDYEQLVKFVDRIRPERVIHLAANLSKDLNSNTFSGLFYTNIEFSAQLAQASLESGVDRFIFISTFSTTMDGFHYFPQTYYAATKKAVEDILVYYHYSTELDVCVLCFNDIYGPHHPHKRFLNLLIDGIGNKLEFHMTRGEQEICFLHIDDAVSSIVSAMDTKRIIDKSSFPIYSIYSNEVFTLSDLPKIVSDHMGISEYNIIFDKPYRKNEIMKVTPMYDRLPNWEPKVDFKTGLKQIIEEHKVGRDINA